MLKKGDKVLLILLTVVIGVTIFLYSRNFFQKDSKDSSKVSVIKQNNKIIKKVNMRSPQIFEVHGKHTNTIEINNGKIRFKHSNCPNKLCTKTGWISKNGDLAVCVPNGVVIQIEGEKDIDELAN